MVGHAGAAPFHPGTGKLPPHLAGREEEKGLFRGLVAGLSKRTAPDSDVVLYGPRGNGKTALLKWVATEAEPFRRIDVVWLNPSEIPDSRVLIARLAPRPFWRRLTPTEASVRGFIWRSRPERPMALTEVLARRLRRRALVVLLDEAHTLDAEVGHNLLNASQQVRVGDSLPFLLVMAGTPDIEDRLASMNASFWNRGEIRPIGRLDAEASADAIRRPLRDDGISITDDALEQVVAESHGYPYFLQLWGRSVWMTADSARESGERSPVIDSGTVRKASPRFERYKRRYYFRRYREMKERSLLRVALSVAQAFDGAASLSESALDKAIAAGLGDDYDADRAAAAEDALRRTGFVWQSDGDTAWEPGIPSLMDYMREVIEKR